MVAVASKDVFGRLFSRQKIAASDAGWHQFWKVGGEDVDRDEGRRVRDHALPINRQW